MKRKRVDDNLDKSVQPQKKKRKVNPDKAIRKKAWKILILCSMSEEFKSVREIAEEIIGKINRRGYHFSGQSEFFKASISSSITKISRLGQIERSPEMRHGSKRRRYEYKLKNKYDESESEYDDDLEEGGDFVEEVSSETTRPPMLINNFDEVETPKTPKTPNERMVERENRAIEVIINQMNENETVVEERNSPQSTPIDDWRRTELSSQQFSQSVDDENIVENEVMDMDDQIGGGGDDDVYIEEDQMTPFSSPHQITNNQIKVSTRNEYMEEEYEESSSHISRRITFARNNSQQDYDSQDLSQEYHETENDDEEYETESMPDVRLGGKLKAERVPLRRNIYIIAFFVVGVLAGCVLFHCLSGLFSEIEEDRIMNEIVSELCGSYDTNQRDVVCWDMICKKEWNKYVTKQKHSEFMEMVQFMGKCYHKFDHKMMDEAVSMFLERKYSGDNDERISNEILDMLKKNLDNQSVRN